MAGGRYRVVRRWGGGELNRPFGITLGPNGDLYVTEDRRGGNIARFTQQGKLVQTWSAGGDYVAGISVAPSGVLYVALYGQRTIKTFLANGKPGLTFITQNRPVGLTVGPNGDVYVATIETEVVGAAQFISAPGIAEGQVQQYSATGGLKSTWDTADAGVPTALTINQVTLSVVASMINQRENQVTMMAFTLAGLIKNQWGQEGSGKGEFKSPSGVCTDATGAIYVADPGNNRVQKFHADGSFIGVMGSATGAADDPDATVFTSPQGVAVSASGMVYVTDYDTGTVVQLAPD